jgi:hypothetical protein
VASQANYTGILRFAQNDWRIEIQITEYGNRIEERSWPPAGIHIDSTQVFPNEIHASAVYTLRI